MWIWFLPLTKKLTINNKHLRMKKKWLRAYYYKKVYIFWTFILPQIKYANPQMKIALIDEHCSSPIVKMAEIKKKKKNLEWWEKRQSQVRWPKPIIFSYFPLITSVSCLFFFTKLIKIRKKRVKNMNQIVRFKKIHMHAY